ncbi:RagB/SusD family nutrient uptake outer membrane protein [Niastella populi]|uniref:Carbohydrate-binding protein SusD n=1 Tax=Niastella populi TaxID=550983 RepID=A0A1V9FK87_9BACT|nr:RagB/SusD family nutrient uptake outer membrane protein [Niastella populi]OQP58779.1 carbohydrate-binding protein SusD [Niastella populi]
MKRIYIPFLLLAVIVTAGTITGCKKEFLEKPKGGDVTVDTIFHTQRQAQYAVADMYGWCMPTGFTMNNSADSREDVLTDQVHLLLPGAAWVAGNLNYQYYIAGGMAPTYSIDRGPITQRGNTGGTAFSSWYKSIRKANLVLKNIDKVTDAPDEWKTDVKGQALFCRAMAHYSAFRLYGGIPIVSDVLAGEGRILIPRSSVQAVVDTLVEWCDLAAAMLPAVRPTNDYGKITSVAALALKARILLYAASPLYNTPDNMKAAVAGARFNDERDAVLCYPSYSKDRWKRAADAAKAVIDAAAAGGVYLYNTGKPATTVKTDNYAGLGDYEAVCNNVFGTTGAYGNPEMILVNTYNQNDPNRNGWADWGRYNFSKVRQMGWGAKNNVPVEFLQMYEKRDGTQWTAAASGTDFKAYFEGLNLDPRAYSSLAYAGQWYNSGKAFLPYYKAAADGTYAKGALVDDTNAGDGTGSAVECSKFVARVDNNNDNHFAWPVFRLAEFYLSYAEALNEFAGPSAEAFQYLNLIRQRAGMPDKDAAMVPDQAAFRTAIQNERSVELAFEDHRYNDLHRWLTAHLVLNQAFRGFTVTASTNGVTPKPTNPFLNWSLVSYGSRTFPVKYYYVPFPYSEISMRYLGNEGWDGQNPGW